MDPVTALAVATLMMLLNGGVLGLVHGDLPAALQPSARAWRIATLLIAAGCVLLAVQAHLPPAFVLPLGNGLMMLGLAGYWHSLRQFYGLPPRAWLLVPVALGTLGIWLFAGPRPDLTARVAIATAVWCLLLGGAAATLVQRPIADRSVARRVLAALFVLSIGFMLLRAAVLPGARALSILDTGPLINLLTPLVVSILPVIGTTAFLLLCSDRIRRQWEHAASTDNLTGLANRRVLAGEGTRLLREAVASGGALSLAIVDVDHFKQVNDTLGHDAGDLALRHVADCLRRACRGGELAARQGGEEFVVVLPGQGGDAAWQRAEALRRAVEGAPLPLAGHGARALTVSVGLASLQPGDRHLDDLLRRADRGLYAAKHGGRNRVTAA